MARNDFQKLTPSEVTRIFRGMSPLKATRYYMAILRNPLSPKENVDLVMQYRQQNPQKFLSDEQMRSQRSTGVWYAERGYGKGYRKNRNYDSDGFSYDQYGNRYDAYGNETGGWNDGGSEPFQGNGSPNGFSRYYGAHNQKPRSRFIRKPISEPRSPEEVSATLRGLKSNVARTKYFNRVLQNSESNIVTVDNLIAFKDANPELFASDEEAAAAGPVAPQRQGFWSTFWKPQEEFAAMSPKKQKFFVRAFRGRNRARNTAYGLRVMTNPQTSMEDKQAMADVVNENPGLFFKNATNNGGKGKD